MEEIFFTSIGSFSDSVFTQHHLSECGKTVNREVVLMVLIKKILSDVRFSFLRVLAVAKVTNSQ